MKIKNLLYILAVSLFLYACTDKTKQTSESKEATIVQEEKIVQKPEINVKEGDVFYNSLKDVLVKNDGEALKPYALDKDTEVYVYYFSASWCPPCRYLLRS